MSRNVGIVGLGKMGLPLSASLLEKGFTVIGFRRHNMDDFVALGGTPASSSKEVAQRSDIVLTCLPSDEALIRAVSGENGLVHGAHPGLIVVEVSMLSIQAKERARSHLQRGGAEMLDCPISGTPAMVLPRKTVFLGSGNKEAFERCMPVFEAITDNSFYLGEFGAGSKMKCVANLLVAVHTLAAAEAMVLSTKAGLDPEMVMKVINPSIAGSTAFAARAPMMVAKRYEPPLGSISQVQEFIRLIDAFAKEVSCPTPMLDVAARYYDAAVAAGRGEQDVSALFAVLGEEAGLKD
jgi:L-threonate 2-dehydrogenase